VTGLQEVAPTGPAISNRQAEIMYLLRRQILGLNLTSSSGRIACTTFPKRSGAITPSASERPMRRSSGSTMTMASYPGERAQGKLDTREGRKHNIQLGFASQRPRRHGRRADQPVDRAVRSHLLLNGGSATLSSI
jgi:intracellular multiplication protein IcmB